MQNIRHYQTLVFDCDGVILDSNQLKIEAYYDTAIAFGSNELQAKALVAHHIKLGGISRYPKFEYFLREILQKPVTEVALQNLLETFGSTVERLLSDCMVAPGLHELRSKTSSRWLVISGGDQVELQKIFKLRGLDSLFDGGIFGSPDNKDEILRREIDNGNILMPALFIGDSRYDHQASTRAGLDFVFLSDWTDFESWPTYCAENQLEILPNLRSLFE